MLGSPFIEAIDPERLVEAVSIEESKRVMLKSPPTWFIYAVSIPAPPIAWELDIWEFAWTEKSRLEADT